MLEDDVSRELAELISRHGALIVELELTREPKPEAPKQELVQLRVKELDLRAKIIAWPPSNRAEAYRKIEHFARVLATGVSLDQATVRFVLRSVQRFL
ncbi:hypothetical protein QD357_26335 [Rhizobium sp. BR 317]|uniref:hypothetical protein n=1 Tax=Rhizobium sp. BR 317 TaxID=3040015 RepID=UPI0039BF6FC4